MRDPKRIEKVLSQLRMLWNTYPDLRLGQLIINVTNLQGDDTANQLFYMEDDELEKRIQEYYELAGALCADQEQG